ncbi:MAG: glycosyltransferase [Nanoarchaeota archaeon]|nr:glycosyltransferase [Nanoarchaeota archaeon]
MVRNMLSVVIPSRNEKYLRPTILDLLKKATQEIEIIAILDGWWPPPDELVDDPRVIYIHVSPSRGMREAINSGVAIAKGEFVMKLDAHCMFSEGFDEMLKADCKDNWVVVPRRKRLDPESWEIIKCSRPDIDYMYLAYPEDKSVWGGKGIQGKEWRQKNLDKDLKSKLIDDLMTAQGSCWFMRKKYFHWLELMDEENYGEFAKEMQEIGLKCWLSGGRMIVNKKVWYAHWHKTKGRGYSLNRKEWAKGTEYTNKWMEGKPWHKQTLDIKWLIEKFKPPTWPKNWWIK